MSGGMLALDDEVALSSYRNEKTFEGSAALVQGDDGYVRGIGDGGAGMVHDKTAPLSEIIEVINERFGTDWTPEDRLLFEQISGDMVADDKLASQARENSRDQFKEVFEPEVLKAFVSRKGRNEKIVNDFMSNADMRAVIIGALLEDVYRQARGL
jgi:type I restriction enzyme R subunit